MTRAAIYTRYSSAAQRESSTADQRRNCERRIEAEGFTVAGHFSDEAISGSTNRRPGYTAMLKAAEHGEFDALVVDDLSRLARDQVEQEQTIRRLEFRGLRIIGVCDGYDSTSKGRKLHRAVKGLMNEVYLDDLRDKTHRGLEGQALRKFSAGGKAYGYRPVPVFDEGRVDVHGAAAVIGYRRELHPEQAAIVREIFERYAAGEPMRQIASDLNARAVPSPGATWHRVTRRKDGKWLVSTLHSILHNEIYIGRYIWNRSEWVRNPDTKRRTRRLRPESEWVVHDMPDLRIVDQATWERAQTRLRAGSRPGRGAKPRYLLSGLLECGVCGAKFIIIGGKHSRYRCGTSHAGGEYACSNLITVRRDLAEELILRPIVDDLLAPKSVEKAVRQIRASAKRPAPKVDVDGELALVEAQIAELERLVREGLLSPALAAPSLEHARKARQAILGARHRKVRPTPAAVFVAETEYRKTVKRMRDLLKSTDVAAARKMLQEHVGPVKLIPAGDHLIARFSRGMTPLMAATGTGVDGLVAGAGYRLIYPDIPLVFGSREDASDG